MGNGGKWPKNDCKMYQAKRDFSIQGKILTLVYFSILCDPITTNKVYISIYLII
jgi:hypothetical protein